MIIEIDWLQSSSSTIILTNCSEVDVMSTGFLSYHLFACWQKSLSFHHPQPPLHFSLCGVVRERLLPSGSCYRYVNSAFPAFVTLLRCQGVSMGNHEFCDGWEWWIFFHLSFSLIFPRRFRHPFPLSGLLAIWFHLFACLTWAAILRLPLAFVLFLLYFLIFFFLSFFLYNFATGACVHVSSLAFFHVSGRIFISLCL